MALGRTFVGAHATISNGTSSVPKPLCAVDELIDLIGCRRKVGRLDARSALAKIGIGFVYIRTIDREVPGCPIADRTVIVTFHPGRTPQPTLAALGPRLIDLDPDRTVIIADSGVRQQHWVYESMLRAMVKIAALVNREQYPNLYSSILHVIG
jgi:hypothetical protein